jgi:lipopolysaccharide transport system ATP-binding protein
MRPIIRVENLGKQYTLGAKTEPYSTLRESLVRAAKKPVDRLRGNGKRVEEKIWALSDVSFDVMPGEVVGIIGRNGAGKSTLLKILSRITEPTTGRVELYGRVGSLLEVGTGFHPELTGRENIYLNGAILGMRREEISKKFDEIVDFAEIEDFLDTPVKRYSSGMYVRLAFAVAAHLEPEILVVDEVLAVGDAQFQLKCIGKMEEVNRKDGRTVLFVSHQLGMVSELCTKGIVLGHGKVLRSGTVSDAISYYVEDQASGNVLVNPDSMTKPAYLSRLRVINELGESVSEVEHRSAVILEMDIAVNRPHDGYGVGLAMLDRFKQRVFTINFNVGKFYIGTSGKKTFRILFPQDFFMPGNYSWSYTVNLDIFDVFDSHHDCGGFRIIDAGSEFASYENFDSGSVFMRSYSVECLD